MSKEKIMITDIDMPFASMVKFMVKWSIASIPAMFILASIVILFWGVFMGLVVGGVQ